MAVFIVGWEIDGYIPVEAATAEEARRLAQDKWDDYVRYVSSFDVWFRPMEVNSLSDAFEVDGGLCDCDGNCTVVGSNKTLKELLS